MEGEPAQVHPAPANFRETALLFGRLRPDQTVGDLFSQIAWSGISRRQLVHAFLDRAPANAAEAAEPANFNAGAAALELFGSPAFRAGIAPRLLRHFPARRRLLFVHVPKAAGTDFQAAMRGAHPWLTEDLSNPELTSDKLLAQRLRAFAKAIPTSETIFLGGHIPLPRLLDDGLFRFHDHLVAIVREPREICVSFANYIMRRFADCPDLSAPDTRGWAQALHMTAADIAATPSHALAISLATRAGIQPINPICSMLGDGTARGVFDTLTRASIEITTTQNYPVWLDKRWSIQRKERVNSSPPLITWNDLSSWQQRQIEAGCAEDKVVYAAIVSCMQASGRLSVFGPGVTDWYTSQEGKEAVLL